MIIKKLTVKSSGYPEALRHIPAPPKQVYTAGSELEELMNRPRLAIVGSRKMSPYGRMATMRIASELAGQGIIIISGLALGVDAAAISAALEAGGACIAVLPSPLDNIVPVANRYLARRLIESGGALVSEYGSGEIPYKQNFIARNRIVSGLADAVLIPEAGEKSGALHTARFGLDQGRNILAIPGNINSPGSVGTNNLIKTSRAEAVTTVEDVINSMGLIRRTPRAKHVKGRNADEQTILNLMLGGINDGGRLLEASNMRTSQFNQAVTMLEIGGKIRPLGANHWALA